MPCTTTFQRACTCLSEYGFSRPPSIVVNRLLATASILLIVEAN
jgi:hypothetical protein